MINNFRLLSGLACSQRCLKETISLFCSLQAQDVANLPAESIDFRYQLSCVGKQQEGEGQKKSDLKLS